MKAPLKSRTLLSFNHEGWKIVVTALRNVEQNRSFLQLFTFLGHFPLIGSDDDERTEALRYLVKSTEHIGRAQVLTNDRKMIFLIIQSRVNEDLYDDERQLVAEISTLMVEVSGVLKLYRRYLSSR